MKYTKEQIHIQLENLKGELDYLRDINHDDFLKHFTYNQLAVPYWCRNDDELLNDARKLLVYYFLNTKLVYDLPMEDVLKIPYDANCLIDVIAVISDFQRTNCGPRLLLDRPSIFSSDDNRYYIYDSHFWFDVNNIMYTTYNDLSSDVNMAIGDVIVLQSEVFKYKSRGACHYGIGRSILSACGQAYDCSGIDDLNIRGYNINSTYNRGNDWVIHIDHLDYEPKSITDVNLHRLSKFRYVTQPSKYPSYRERIHQILKY